MLDDGRWLAVGALIAAAAAEALRDLRSRGGAGSSMKVASLEEGFLYRGEDGSWRRAAVVHRSPRDPNNGIIEYAPFDLEAWRDTLDEGEPFLRMPLTTFAKWAVERQRV